MKYYEQIKSVILLLLVTLSILLTFLNWNYQPNYKIIEETKVETKTVGESKTLQEVFLPYRVIVSENNKLLGDVSTNNLNHLMWTISNWKTTELKFEQNNITIEEINNLITKNRHITLFYSVEVPFKVFQSILTFSKSEIPESSFDRIMIDWSKLDQSNFIKIHFVNTKENTLYSTTVFISESNFHSNVLEPLEGLTEFKEVKRNNALSLYVPIEPVKLYRYTYYIDEVSPDKFRDVLFHDPNIVKKNNDSSDSLKYTDGMSLMTVDTNSKVFNFVNPASEKLTDISISDLVNYSFQYINNHGGFNGDFRYVSVNLEKHVTDYQLFMHGYPVFSSITSTHITSTWGNNQIFRYKRPFYLLEMDISSEKKSELLYSGIRIINTISQSSKLDLSAMDDLIVGYNLVQNDSDLLYTLEPSWFAIIKGNWIRLSPELLGGVEYGLE